MLGNEVEIMEKTEGKWMDSYRRKRYFVTGRVRKRGNNKGSLYIYILTRI
jgi:hypothetical protein